MSGIEQSVFGELGGEPVHKYKLKGPRGIVLGLMTYGAAITELSLPDRLGRAQDVVLGFDDLQGYVDHTAFFGAVIGRVANRIRNGVFVLEGERYQLEATDGPDHLHGGWRGWDRRIWRATPSETEHGQMVLFEYSSADGEEGYPGRVDASVRYTLAPEGVLSIDMRARSERTTIVNMAQHTYWNLAGPAAQTVLDHELVLDAEFYTPGDPIVPTGYLERVANTPFDFRGPKLIGKDLAKIGNDPVGYDHNFIVNGVPGALRPVARLRHPASGRKLTLEADAPGVQLYSSNFLKGNLVGKGGKRYPQYAGLCLETQAFPNSINVPEWEGQVILAPGQEYHHLMVLRFSAD